MQLTRRFRGGRRLVLFSCTMAVVALGGPASSASAASRPTLVVDAAHPASVDEPPLTCCQDGGPGFENSVGVLYGGAKLSRRRRRIP